MSREDKLAYLENNSCISKLEFSKIIPNKFNDWLSHRSDDSQYVNALKKKKKQSDYGLFETHSLGVATGCDPWAYNSSYIKLQTNIAKMLSVYNEQIDIYDGNFETVERSKNRISWTDKLKSDLKRKVRHNLYAKKLVKSIYRPFTKTNLYFAAALNQRQYLNKQLFGNDGALENLIITASGSGKNFSLLISNVISDLNLHSGGAQCFPIYIYEENTEEGKDSDLFNQTEINTVDKKYTRKDGVSDEGLKHFQDAYPTEMISKEDIFYYVYGLLHSEDYRTRYADNLTKDLPRIPCVKKTEDFWIFSKAGRDLAHWHLNYETVEPYKAKLDLGSKSIKQLEDKDFYVTNMTFAKNGKEKIKDTVVYNNAITIREIPVEAYDYVVNGKSALEWVMERQGVSTHKDSGIENDANDWAIETMGDARYPLDLFLRVITVSLETMKIVRSLPKLDI